MLEAEKDMSTAANELRKDYLLDRWVVIAAQRKKRPTDFAKPKEKRQEGTCAFCPGNEHMTPPAVLLYLSRNGGIVKDKDTNGMRPKNWLVRVVPNLYPAFTPPKADEAKVEHSSFVLERATWHH